MKRERRYLLERVANLYFKEDMKQELIAKKLGISRPNISRLLNEAKKKGIVEIKINYENKDATYRRELAEKIEKKYGLLETILVQNLPTEEETKNAVSEVAASFFDDRVTRNSVVGVTAGTTLEMTAKKIREKKRDVSIVTLIGSVDYQHTTFLSHEIARIISSNIDGKSFLLTVPALLSSKEMAQNFLCQPGVEKTLSLFKKIKWSFLGIGAISSDHPFLHMFDKSDLEKIKSEAVGNIGTIFYNENEEIVCEEITEKTFGIKADQLMDIPYRVGIASGKKKTPAILGAVKSKLVNILIIDIESGKKLLSQK
jgi:deoxyribonucleoside regulator